MALALVALWLVVVAALTLMLVRLKMGGPEALRTTPPRSVVEPPARG